MNFGRRAFILCQSLFISAALAPALPAAEAQTIVPVPAIPEVPASTVYQLKVNGVDVAVNDEKRFDFQTAAFTMSGPATVEITLPNKAAAVVRPLRYKITPEIKDSKLTFSLPKPLNLVVEVEGKPPLALFATPPETETPKASDPHTLYFGPGVHEPGIIRPESGQTVYLAPGALVKGRIEAKDVKDVAVRGRGVLDAGSYSVRKDKTNAILFAKCSNIKVEGIGVRGGSWWQTLFLLTDQADISHMNILGTSVNTDGIDIDGVRNFTARDCFIRCEDDGFGWHAVDARTNGEPVTENCLAEDCVIWNTRFGNGLRIGASMETQLFQNITFRNIDVLRHAGAAIRSDHSDWALCKNIRFENFTDESSAQTVEIVIAKTRYSNDNGFKDERGNFEGLYFVNLNSPAGEIKLLGSDADHKINNVTFENCRIGDKPVESESDLVLNAFVTGISFKKDSPAIK